MSENVETPPDQGFIEQMKEVVRLATQAAPTPINFKSAERSPSIAKLTAALAKAQGAILMASKDHEASIKTTAGYDYKYRYADLAAVWEVARKPLAENGLAVLQPASVDAPRVCVVTMVAHESGEWMSCAITLVAKDTAPQSLGSAITYARRYGLSAMVGIASEVDDDAQAAQPAKGQAPPPASPAAAPPAATKKATPKADGAPEPIVSKFGENKGKELHEWPDAYLGEVMENLWRTLSDPSKAEMHFKVTAQLMRMQEEALARLTVKLPEMASEVIGGRIKLVREAVRDMALTAQKPWNEKLLAAYEGEQTRRLALATGTEVKAQ